MKHVEKLYLNNFEEKYNNNGWVYTLKRVKELKKALLSKKTEQLYFWSDGTWACSKNVESSIDKEEPLLILTQEDFKHLDQQVIESSIYSICQMIFYLDHPLNSMDIHDYLVERKNTDLRSFLMRDLFLNYNHSYKFIFRHDGYQFDCKIDWNNSEDPLRIIIDEQTRGIAAGIRYLINYLFEISEEMRHDKKYFSHFCKEIRKFEEYYYSVNGGISQTTTPTEVLLLQKEGNHETCGNLIKINDLINYFDLDVTLQNEADGEKYIEFNILFDSYHDLYGYMDVNSIKFDIIDFLNEDLLEFDEEV